MNAYIDEMQKIIEEFDCPNKKIFLLDKSNSSITEVDEEIRNTYSNLIENKFNSVESIPNCNNVATDEKSK